MRNRIHLQRMKLVINMEGKEEIKKNEKEKKRMKRKKKKTTKTRKAGRHQKRG